MERKMGGFNTLSTPLKWLLAAHGIAVLTPQQQRECQGVASNDWSFLVHARCTHHAWQLQPCGVLCFARLSSRAFTQHCASGTLSLYVLCKQPYTCKRMSMQARGALVPQAAAFATGETACLRQLACGDPVLAFTKGDEQLETFMEVSGGGSANRQVLEQVRSSNWIGFCARCSCQIFVACQQSVVGPIRWHG
jgi:hypothetical protein